MTRDEWLEVWLDIGNANAWIKQAWDPPFDKDSFYFCHNRDELKVKLSHGNWCLGAAFVLGELCFINQVNGGDEWMVIRGHIRFESITSHHMLESGEFDEWLDRVERATNKQLRDLDY